MVLNKKQEKTLKTEKSQIIKTRDNQNRGDFYLTYANYALNRYSCALFSRLRNVKKLSSPFVILKE